jgi:hypothetical protein
MSEENNTEAVAEEVAAEVTEGAPAAPTLTVQDLANLRNIIDVASQRGTFKPAEFQVVGEAYAKLDNFIQSITPPPAEEAPAAPAAETTGE